MSALYQLLIRIGVKGQGVKLLLLELLCLALLFQRAYF